MAAPARLPMPSFTLAMGLGGLVGPAQPIVPIDPYSMEDYNGLYPAVCPFLV